MLHYVSAFLERDPNPAPTDAEAFRRTALVLRRFWGQQGCLLSWFLEVTPIWHVAVHVTLTRPLVTPFLSVLRSWRCSWKATGRMRGCVCRGVNWTETSISQVREIFTFCTELHRVQFLKASRDGSSVMCSGSYLNSAISLVRNQLCGRQEAHGLKISEVLNVKASCWTFDTAVNPVWVVLFQEQMASVLV